MGPTAEINESPHQAVQLPPFLSEAFHGLRKGRHICRADGRVWFDLRDNAEQYQLIFTALGYTLTSHPRGFYYFSQGQQTRSDALSRLVYFFACLFSDLDQGRFNAGDGRWVDTLTCIEFDMASLTQNMFAASDRQRVFDQLNVTPDSFDKSIIASLVRYGIAIRLDGARLRLREGVYRFLELFQKCGEDESSSKIAQPAAPAETFAESDDDEDEVTGEDD